MERKSVILVTVLEVVAFLSGSLANSYGIVTPESKHIPTLHTQLFTQSVTFSKVWNFTGPCGAITPMFNFTITLAGKDAGSDWVNFIPTPTGDFSPPLTVDTVFNSNNIPPLSCSTEPVILSAAIFSGPANYWRVLQSGNYSALTTFGPGFAVPTPIAVESWTVTTVT